MSVSWLDEDTQQTFARHGLTGLADLCAFAGGELVTSARTRTLRRVELDGRRFYLKTQELARGRLPLRKWPSYAFKGSPLVREALALDTLGALGYHVPRLLALGSERGLVLPRRAMLLTRELPSHVDLVRYLEHCDDRAERDRVCALAEELVRSIHERGWVMLGAKYRNLLVPCSGPPDVGSIAIVDQPALRRSRSARLRAKDLRLLRHDLERHGRLA